MITRAWILALLMLALAGCSALHSGKPIKDVTLSPAAVSIPVPVVLQDSEFDCGVSTISMLLAYYGKPCERERAAAFKAKARTEKGLSGGDLEQFLKAEGFEVRLFAGELSHEIKGLYYHLDRGRPPVIALNIVEGSNHFVLATGYDRENDWLLLQDPTRGALVITTGQFEIAWERAKRFTLLATPR